MEALMQSDEAYSAKIERSLAGEKVLSLYTIQPMLQPEMEADVIGRFTSACHTHSHEEDLAHFSHLDRKHIQLLLEWTWYSSGPTLAWTRHQ